MGEKLVRLYTRQNDKTLHALEQKGRIINERKYVELHFGVDADLFLESYDWFTGEASKRLEKPEDVRAPIWCSISTEGCLKPIDSTVVYVLEVPESKVIYFDAMKWDHVLNRIYLPEDEEDARRYEEHLQHLGVADGFSFFIGKYRGMFPEEEQRIRQSWHRAFEIDDWSPFRVTGNIWEIRREWVKKIVHPGERIPEDDEVL
ncbi:MAG: DUF3841 domain-containing protein [Filifactor alocis]|nr:DUF3841 domain-containing protein [Filifactor alocis]